MLELDCSPGSPGQWTVVAITLGVGAVCGDTRGKPHPGPDNLPEQTDRALTGKDQDRSPRRWTIDRRPADSARKRRSSPELDGILTSLHTKRSRQWGVPLPAEAFHMKIPSKLETESLFVAFPNATCQW
ncbi:hypothetical protein MBOURGENBZM_02640 [Methanoculleus bourgensis]|nr:hypothetical protein MBOURGENBZM_02640 [Methanoculleus bourgensis]